MKKISVYIGEMVPNKQTDLPVLHSLFNSSVRRRNELFFRAATQCITEDVFEVVSDPSHADYFLLPYNYHMSLKYPGYFDRFAASAHDWNKQMIIFEYSDFHESIPVDNAIVFRTSLYRHTKKNNEYIVPPFVEDLGKEGILIRKKSDKPTISFCGWANYSTKSSHLKSFLYNVWLDFWTTTTHRPYLRAYKKGLYFRAMAIKKLLKSPLIRTSFIIRKSYSGHRKTIEIDPQRARDEYVQNIRDSDFVLAIKGDGNYSQRFYEAMSLGRIPLFVDTDCVLPAESQIEYSDFIFRINFDDLSEIDRKISDFYQNITNEEFERMQLAARKVFEQHLRGDAFIKYIYLVLNSKIVGKY